MIQGTTSNAGKSVIATGICRLMARNGVRVAPFKPQNMSLNSAVTDNGVGKNGGEIGRAQAVQAMAAGIAPHTDMNPILLKPNSDKGAQVIIHGRAIGNMTAREFHQFKAKGLAFALESFDRLAREFELVVVEGAGSPAEINLRENDIANMGFALARDCPVIIVADIDRGGVFAHLKGTMDCLDSAEKKLVKGFIINRFRGDRSLLDSGIEWLEQQTGVATIGVLPYLKGLYIEAEDAVDERSNEDFWALPRSTASAQTGCIPARDRGNEAFHRLQIVIPRLPRISNHTDFDVLRLHPHVNVKFVLEGEPIPPADLVILPGSKSTIGDLNWLYENHWGDYLRRHLRYGGKVLGICGGYQMLGKKIHDPQGLEGAANSIDGLAVLDVETVLEPYKQLAKVAGTLTLNAEKVRGYEIHLGTTTGAATRSPLVKLVGEIGGDIDGDFDRRFDGAVSADNLVIGTYLHGIFDHNEARNGILAWSGLKAQDETDYDALRVREFDRVADAIEAEISLARLKSLCGL